MSEKQRASEFKNTFAGGFGGMCTVVVGHPFDTIKVRLQTQSSTNPIYSGTADCVRKTVSKEGPRALYKGMFAPLMASSPIFALSFVGFGFGKKIQQSHPDEAVGPLQLAAAGTGQDRVVYLVDSVRGRHGWHLQLAGSHPHGRRQVQAAGCSRRHLHWGGGRAEEAFEERGTSCLVQGLCSHSAQVVPCQRGLLHGLRGRDVRTQCCGPESLGFSGF